MSRSVLLPAALTVALSASPSWAAMVTFKGDLSGHAVSPAVTTQAMGDIEATLDTSTRKLTWKGGYKGLQGKETGAHFHGPAAPGQNAPPVIDVTLKKGGFEGSATLDEKQVKDLEDGKWYLNIHSDRFPEGELRAQMKRVR